jgi:hypothetical protein
VEGRPFPPFRRLSHLLTRAQDWCARNWPPVPQDWVNKKLVWPPGQQLPGDLVDEGKLLLFMKEEVVSRAPKKGARVTKQRKRRAAGAGTAKHNTVIKRRRLVSGIEPRPPRVTRPASRPSVRSRPLTGLLEDTIEVATWAAGAEVEDQDPAADEALLGEEDLQLQYNTIRGYISAIQRLYEEQKSRNMNPAPRPQGIALKALKKGILAVVWNRKRSEYRDRLEGTIKDVYTPSQIPDHTAAVWESSDDVSALLRTQVDFLLGNHMLLRQSNRLAMELPDCFCLELPNEGQKSRHCPTYALVIVMNQGKTNQHGRMEYGAALRHRDVRSCLIGALAFYFFWRWQVEGKESFPSFARSEQWYDLKVLRRSATEPKALLSPQTARSWTSKLYSRCGIATSKVSHAPRVAAAQNADMAGVAEGQVRHELLICQAFSNDLAPLEHTRVY